ncbi:MAG: cell division protein FtsA [Nitrospirota bacterium]
MEKGENIIVGLDIGTTKICAIVGDVLEGTKVNIIGIGTSPSRGLKKGVVVNIESTIESIRRAVEEAELMAGVQINSVYAGIAGAHIKGLNSRGVVAVKDSEISRTDIERVIDAARAMAIPKERRVLHIIPQEFIVDEQGGIKDPLGICGERLEAEVYIITGVNTSAMNIIKCIEKAGLDVADIILQPLASSEAVLCPEEKELGVAMVDIGGGTTDLAVFIDGSIWHTTVLGIGGNYVTNDIAIGLRTPVGEAEKIKIKYGNAVASMVMTDEKIEVPGVGGRPSRILSRQLLSEIIEPRAEEIFTLVSREIKKTGYEERVVSGVVITGGTAIMDGMIDVAERILDLPVRMGMPINIGGLVDIVSSPIYSTGVGLIFYALKNRNNKDITSETGTIVCHIHKIKRWLNEVLLD